MKDPDCIVKERDCQACLVLVLADERRLTVLATVQLPDVTRMEFTVRGPIGTALDHFFHKEDGRPPEIVTYEAVTTDGRFEASVVVSAKRPSVTHLFLDLDGRCVIFHGPTDKPVVATLTP